MTKWARFPLAEVAPVAPATHFFGQDDVVWQLGLDQIESHTGRVLAKLRRPMAEAGSSTFAFDESNILYSKLRPYLNKVVLPDEPGIATSELIPLRPRLDVVVPAYLAYYLRSSQFVSFASQFVTGAKMPRVILSKFRGHHVPLPPLSEQRRIVDILDQADHLRRLRAEAKANADRILPALFLKMFGDPDTNPMGWPSRTLGDVVLSTHYGTSVRPNTNRSGIPVVRMNNIRASGELDLRDIKFVALDERDVQRYRLEPGDILFNRTNSEYLVGKTGIWADVDLSAVAASYIIRVRVDRSMALPEFVWALMNSASMKALLPRRARRASGMANINATELRELPAVLPPLHRQSEFAAAAIRLRRLVCHQRRSLDAMDRLFRHLTAAAFSGALTTSWRKSRTGGEAVAAAE